MSKYEGEAGWKRLKNDLAHMNAKQKREIIKLLKDNRTKRIALWEAETVRLFGPGITKLLKAKLAVIQEGVPLIEEEKASTIRHPRVTAALKRVAERPPDAAYKGVPW